MRAGLTPRGERKVSQRSGNRAKRRNVENWGQLRCKSQSWDTAHLAYYVHIKFSPAPNPNSGTRGSGLRGGHLPLLYKLGL